MAVKEIQTEYYKKHREEILAKAKQRYAEKKEQKKNKYKTMDTNMKNELLAQAEHFRRRINNKKTNRIKEVASAESIMKKRERLKNYRHEYYLRRKQKKD